MTADPLGRVGTVDAVAADLRRRVLSGELLPGTWLRERELTQSYGVARHSLRAALRQLAVERLVQLVPNRGARVTILAPEELRGLYELRCALETEAARLLAERHGLATMPGAVVKAAAALDEACGAPEPDHQVIDEAHATLHHALVVSAGSGRIAEAHAALDAETSIFLRQLRPLVTPEEMASGHQALLADLRTVGPEAVRRHLSAATEQLVQAMT